MIPLLHSSSVPAIFEPVKIGDHLLVDGGLLNNFPVEPLENKCDLLIGCNVNFIPKGLGNGKRIGKMNLIEKCFHMAIASVVYSKVEKLDLFIEPDLHEFGMFDVTKADLIYETGYQATMKHKNKLLSFVQ